MSLTTLQALAEIREGSNEDNTHSRNMPAIYVEDDGRIFVHIGPNELAGLSSTRDPATTRIFKTIDAAYREAHGLCVRAGLVGFQRIEICQHTGNEGHHYHD